MSGVRYHYILACVTCPEPLRTIPNAAVSNFLSDLEIEVLYIKLYARGLVKNRPPPASLKISTAVVDIARYAGFRPFKPSRFQSWRKYEK